MQEAKELAHLIDDLKNSPLRIDLELSQLETKRAKLEKGAGEHEGCHQPPQVQPGSDT